MALRLYKKGVLMSLRNTKSFVIFTLMYTILIFWTSYSIELIMGANGGNAFGITSFLISLGASIFLSLLYAWLIVRRNRRTWATLKCIGYTNKNINSLAASNIIFTTLMGFIIVLEILFHYAAILGYLQAAEANVSNATYFVKDLPLISLSPVIATCIMFLIVQILAIVVASQKIKQVRPIIALKKVGE
ncbi:MAG: FtsX-like permease family protein [Promethearchaeia archaeon]